jgi:hypothetical protein
MLKDKLFIALAIAACSTVVAADDDVNYSFSLKAWNHRSSSGSSSSYVNAPILALTAKKGDYFLTASSLLPTNFIKEDGTYFSRRDFDLAAGYSLNSNISVLGGYKRIYTGNWNFSGTTATSTPQSVNIPYLGLNGFSSIGDKSFLFGTVTRGIKVSQSGRSSTDPADIWTTLEGGYGYLLNKNTQLSAGIRLQNMKNSDSTTLSGVIFGVTLTP